VALSSCNGGRSTEWTLRERLGAKCGGHEQQEGGYLVGDALKVGHGTLPHSVQRLLLADLLHVLADVLIADALARDDVLDGLIEHLHTGNNA
jgi:hypothetical protein